MLCFKKNTWKVVLVWHLDILGDPGVVSQVGINGSESFQEWVRELLGCYSKQTSSMTHLNTCLSEATIYRAAFLILLYEGVCLQTWLFTVPVWLVQESFQNWTLPYSTYQFKLLKDRLLSILDRHVQEIILHSLKVKYFSSVTQEDRMKAAQ